MAGLIPKVIRQAIVDTVKRSAVSRPLALHAYKPITGEPTEYPCLLVSHATGADYATTFGAAGIAEMPFRVEIRCQSADGISGEMALDDLMAAGTGADSSIYDALNADRTLGGKVATYTVVDVEQPEERTSPDGTDYWRGAFVLSIKQPRS